MVMVLLRIASQPLVFGPGPSIDGARDNGARVVGSVLKVALG